MARRIRGIRDPIRPGSLIGRTSPGLGSPEELEAGTVKTFLTLEQEDIEDIVAALINNSNTVTWAYNDPAGTLVATSFADSSVPASAVDDGVAGTMAYESGFLYVCVATDTWERVAIATW